MAGGQTCLRKIDFVASISFYWIQRGVGYWKTCYIFMVNVMSWQCVDVSGMPRRNVFLQRKGENATKSIYADHKPSVKINQNICTYTRVHIGIGNIPWQKDYRTQNPLSMDKQKHWQMLATKVTKLFIMYV